MTSLLWLSLDLRALSRSRTEIVLPYEYAVEAVRQLVRQRVPLLGWEGQVRTADGTVLFTGAVRGTQSTDQRSDEDWDAYVARSAAMCLRTMGQEVEMFRYSPDAAAGALFFCLVPSEPP